MADDLIKAAEDPSVQAYVDEATGAVILKDATTDPGLLRERAASGLRQATEDDIAARQRYLTNTTAGAQAQAAGKLAANTATFGLTGFDSPADKQQIKDFRDASPTLSTLTEVAGAAAPGALGGLGAGAAMTSLGFGARAASIGSMVAEEVAQSAAVEREQAAEEGRGIEITNVISGIPLAFGVSAAARVARSGGTFASHAANKAAKRLAGGLPDVADVAREANAISAGAATGRARRSVGAAAADDARVPLAERQVRDIAENYDTVAEELNKVGGDSIDDVLGGQAPAFDEVHNVGLKRGDVEGRMTDAKPDKILDFADTHIGALDELATELEQGGQKSAAGQIRAEVQKMGEAYTLADTQPEAMALAADQAKRTVDRLRSKYGAMRDTPSLDISARLDEVNTPLRKALEDKGTWGEIWSEKQALENELWTEMIPEGAMWQSEVLNRAPGAAGKVRKGPRDMPVFVTRGDITEHFVGMTDKKFKETLSAMRNWSDLVERKTQIMQSHDVASLGRTPVARLEKGIEDIRALADGLEDTRHAMLKRGGKEIAAKSAAKRTARGPLEAAFDVAEQLPGIGGVARAGREGIEAATGRPMFEVPVKPYRPDLTTEQAREAMKSRFSRGEPSYRPSGGGDGGGIPRPGPRLVPDDASGLGAVEGGPGQGGLGGKAGDVQVPGRHVAQERVSPVSLEGKTLDDLRALPIDDPADRARVEALKKNPDFAARGAVKGNDAEHGVTLVDDGGEIVLRDGRHRLTAAQELGLPALRGRIVDGATGKVIFQGDIPLKAAAAKTGTRGAASVGAMATAGALGVAGLAAHPVTELLKGMNDDSKAIRERAALGLMAPATRPQPLPSTIERFREGGRNLAQSFELRKDDLITALSNPEALLAGLDDAFGDLGETHPQIYGDILARSHAAAQYTMANAPPSVAIGLSRPDGISPDPLALAKFADIWSGAFNPGDVIYDVGTGTATPTQVKALKDVHPDVYDALRLDILKAVDEAEGRIPFETLRKLDVLFDVPGIAPPSFQPAMSKTMQQAWKEPAGGNRAKAESAAAGPGDPMAKFANGPSSMGG